MKIAVERADDCRCGRLAPAVLVEIAWREAIQRRRIAGQADIVAAIVISRHRPMQEFGAGARRRERLEDRDADAVALMSLVQMRADSALDRSAAQVRSPGAEIDD